MADRLQGVVTPLLTPYNDDLSVATDLYLDHARACLAAGAHYLAPFGTTSEATSHSVRERMQVLDLLVSSGVARADQLMPGTGLCALEETLTLCRHAADLGCAAVMTLPPFFFVNASDEGLYRYFSLLIEGIGADAPRICLYHIPQLAGIGISPGLAARLNAAFPEVVVAYKDSSGAWDNTRAVIAAAPALSVFPGSESLMCDALRIGGAGCISASCNSNAAAIRALYDHATAGHRAAEDAAQGPVDRHRQALQAAGLIPALKSLQAHSTGDRRWLTLRPPLQDADPALGADLAATL
jgi:4-hydroxy-tetrahydrodipicolinate synthase